MFWLMRDWNPIISVTCIVTTLPPQSPFTSRSVYAKWEKKRHLRNRRPFSSQMWLLSGESDVASVFDVLLNTSRYEGLLLPLIRPFKPSSKRHPQGWWWESTMMLVAEWEPGAKWGLDFELLTASWTRKKMVIEQVRKEWRRAMKQTVCEDGMWCQE